MDSAVTNVIRLDLLDEWHTQLSFIRVIRVIISAFRHSFP
jgi:hypothetical protein